MDTSRLKGTSFFWRRVHFRPFPSTVSINVHSLFAPLLLLLVVFCSCKKDDKCSTPAQDFETLMGKNLPAWEHVQTKEDFDNLNFFKQLYEEGEKRLSVSATSECKIPKVLHFIWLGPKPFPRESVENVRTWIAKNPDWKIKFWTDRERPLPHPAMEKQFVKDFRFLELGDCFNKSDNYGEKSDVLRYEILYQEGGIYVDHDVKCLKPFQSLNSAFDLYCGMEVPYQTSLSSSVLPTNNLLAARPHHPVLKQCLSWLKEKWDQIERDYPGKDRDAVINRVSHRTFLVLGETLKRFANRDGNSDIAFPSYYFNAPSDELALMARHLYAGSWFENESHFEKMVRERLMLLSKKSNKTLLYVGVLAILNLFCFAALFIYLRDRKSPKPSKKIR